MDMSIVAFPINLQVRPCLANGWFVGCRILTSAVDKLVAIKDFRKFFVPQGSEIAKGKPSNSALRADVLREVLVRPSASLLHFLPYYRSLWTETHRSCKN